MSVREEREKKHLYTARRNNELLVVEAPRSLFKVVVNNSRRQERFPDKQQEEIVETKMSGDQGLPPQPAGYLKFPKYDWF